MSMRTDKMLIPAAGKPLIYYTLTAFNDHPEIDTITIITNKNNQDKIRLLTKKYRMGKVKSIHIGGLLRQTSLEKGLDSLKAKPEDIVLVHNGANPLPSRHEITETIHQAQEHGAAIVGHPVTSTIKEIDEQHIIKTHDRQKLFAAETPQAAQYQLLKKALKNAKEKQLEVTDEAMLLEAIGHKVVYVTASENNFKVTTQSDLHKLKSILGEHPADFRVGIGQDSHEFDTKKGLTLAGVHFKQEFKLKANSDGDVILHAIFNALSQALGDKSLGFYADPLCEQGVTDSREYLKPVLQKLEEQNFQISSLGLMIECKNPKIDPISADLKKSLGKILQIPTERIGITATSGETLTAFGRGLGIQCFAIISLTSQKPDKK